MKLLKRITVDRIMSWRPCSTWTRERVEAAFAGRRSLTPLEVAGLDVPAPDVIWVLLREEVIPPRELRLIACWCAERALKGERKSGREPDARSWAAVRVSRLFARGQATEEELSAAWAAAGPAAWGAAWDAARGAAWAAAGPAAWGAAGDAARDAAWAAAWAAAGAAAGDAAWAAAGAATLRHVRRVLRRIA